ncbi:MAG: hypothetical protein J7L07_02125, partial [Candidatus Odinarchaeota archaeon]|nr:hypothetical protein [Candidatus Odinarchaeota archaeon]
NFLVDLGRNLILVLIDQFLTYTTIKLMVKLENSPKLLSQYREIGVSSTCKGKIVNPGLTQIDIPYKFWHSLRYLYHRSVNGITNPTKAMINIAKLTVKLHNLVGDNVIVFVPLVTEQLVVDKETGEVKWLNMNHFDYIDSKANQNFPERFIPLGVYRRTTIAFGGVTEDGSVGFLPIVELIVEKGDNLVIDEKALKAILGETKVRAINENLERYIKNDDKSARMNLEKLGMPEYLIKFFEETKITDITKVTYDDFRNWGMLHLKQKSIVIDENEVKIEKIEDVIKVALRTNYINYDPKTGKMISNNENIRIIFSQSNEYYDGIVAVPKKYDESIIGIDKNKDPSGKRLYDVSKDLFGKGGNKTIKKKFNENLYKNMDLYFKRVYGDNKLRMDSLGGILGKLFDMEIETKEGKINFKGVPDAFHLSLQAQYIDAPILATQVGIYTLNEINARIKASLDKKHLGYSKNKSARIIKLLRVSIIEAYRLALMYGKDPKEIIFSVNGKNNDEITRFTLQELYEARNEIFSTSFTAVSGSNDEIRIPDKITINGKTVNGIDFLKSIMGGYSDIKITGRLGKAKTGIIEIPSLANSELEISKPALFDLANKITYPLVTTTNQIVNELEINIHRIYPEILGSSIEYHPTMEAIKVLFDLFDSISLKRNVAEIIYKYEIIMSHFIKQAYEIKKKIDSEKDKVVKEKLKEQYISLLKQSESWISDLKDLLLSKTEYVKNKPEVNLLIQLTRIYLLGEKTARQFTKGLQKAFEFKIFGIFSVYFVTAFAITLLQHDSKLYLSITTDKTFLESFGILLTILNLVIFNCDLDHLDSIFNGDKKPETLIITNNNEEVETSDKLYKIEQGLQFLGIFLVSLGMFLKSFGAPFYMGLELVHKIGEIIGQHLGEQAEYVWNTVAGFEIPLIGQTVFEFVVNLALGGWMDAVINNIVGMVLSYIADMIMNYIANFIGDITVDFLLYNTIN